MNNVIATTPTRNHRRNQSAHLLALLLIAAAFLLTGCASEYHMEMTVNDDGSVELNTRVAMDRQQVDQMIKWSDPSSQARMNRRHQDEEGWEDVVEEGVVIKDEVAEDEIDLDKPLTDQQIIDGYTKIASDQSPLKDIEGITQELSSVTVDEDTVHIEGSTRFDSLELFVKHGYYYWRATGIESFVIDKDDQGNLTITAKLSEQAVEQSDYIRHMLRNQDFIGSFRLTLPGEIVSSPLPNTETNQTWIDIDGSNKESLDQITPLIVESLTIVAKPGVLDLASLPLDTQELAEPIVYNDPDEPDPHANLPIVDAPEGYYAESETLTVSNIVLLPQAKEKLGERVRMFSREFNNTANIRAKLYAPENGKILSLEEVKVQNAIDDQGNTIKEYTDPENGYISRRYYGRINPSDDESNTVTFEVTLDLPAPGAQAIEEITGSLIVTAFDDWNTHRIPRVRANPDKTIDLSGILPGATLKINRYRRHVDSEDSYRQLEGRFELEIFGPPEIENIQFTVELTGEDRIHAYPSSDQTSTTDGKSQRVIDLQYSEWSDEITNLDATLIIHYPQGIRRERVPFLLEAMDMY